MNIYSKRREKFARDLGNGSIAVLFSSDNQFDPEFGFKVNRNFYYLTGLEKESMVLVLENKENVIKETLFILPFDEVMAKWVGGRMLKEEATKVSDVQDVRDFADVESYVFGQLSRNRANSSYKLFLDLWDKENSETLASSFGNQVKKKYPNVIIKDAFSNLARLRLIKDDYEVTCLVQAIAITSQGIKSMMKAVKPNMNEMVMEGAFNFALAQQVTNETSFKTICASGPRACILHYSENNQVMQDGDLLLTDLGATYKHYCADITRTYPINGKFSDRQKELYQIVLNAQKIVEKNAKVGMKVRDLDNMVVEYYKQELPKHGLNKDVREYYYHFISHHLGLDCHDMDGGLGNTLEAGNVITNEPGLYVADEGIGIRIEDDLLITGTGAVNLSKNIIKEIADIEAFMNK